MTLLLRTRFIKLCFDKNYEIINSICKNKFIVNSTKQIKFNTLKQCIFTMPIISHWFHKRTLEAIHIKKYIEFA